MTVCDVRALLNRFIDPGCYPVGGVFVNHGADVRLVFQRVAGLDEAPVHIAAFCVADTMRGHGLGRRTMPEMLAYSAVMAAHTLWLAARAHGIGLGWVSIFDPDRIAADLDVPRDWRFIGYLCLGYPQEATLDPELQRAGWEHRDDPGAFILRR